MGEAKRRGSRVERVAQSIERKKHEYVVLQKKHQTERKYEIASRNRMHIAVAKALGLLAGFGGKGSGT